MSAPRIAIALLLCAGLSLTQSPVRSPNPFLDKSDTGATVHVLPPPAVVRANANAQPLEASVTHETAVYPPVTGFGKLINHGGPIIANPAFEAIYWNSSVALSNATSLGYPAVQDQIRAFVLAFPKNANWDNATNDDYEIIQQYGGTNGSPANTLHYVGTYVDSRQPAATITDSQVQGYLMWLFGKGLAVNAGTIYGVYFPSGMQVTMNNGTSCSTFCGYHGHFTYNGTAVRYAVFPYPDCTACSVAGKAVADILTIVTGHEIREAVTDPGEGTLGTWFDLLGYEADDKCAWSNLYQMTNGGFWVQPEFSNGGKLSPSGIMYPGPGCVVPNQ